MAAAPAVAAPPPGFAVRTVAAGLSFPTDIAYAPDGRAFIAEKEGVVKVLTPSGEITTLLDISDRVNNFFDRGLLGIALDRDFATNRELYLLYMYDHPANVPQDGPEGVVSTLSRVTVLSNTQVSPEETVIGEKRQFCTSFPPLGFDKEDCIPSDANTHGIGTVISDPTDGTLWLGQGDSAGETDLDSSVGSLRTYEENRLVGKIVHIDRDGRGLPGHPFCPGETDLDTVCTKIHAKGFRNPFRFIVRPGRDPIVADVGWNTKEEIDVVRAGGNYGWPCYEGSIRTPEHEAHDKCEEQYQNEGDPALAAVPPIYDYDHNGAYRAAIAGPVYGGGRYPDDYDGDLFIADFGASRMDRLPLDAAGNRDGDPIPFLPSPDALSPVKMVQNLAGNLVYVDIGGSMPDSGVVSEVVFHEPAARASATPTSGDAPLEVQFTGSGSVDPTPGSDLEYDWDFGDGSGSSDPDPRHTYDAGEYVARLTVTDDAGHTDVETIAISVGGNRVPTPAITSAPPSFRAGVPVGLEGSATDFEDGAIPAEDLDWNVTLIHGDPAVGGHTHQFTTGSVRVSRSSPPTATTPTPSTRSP